jgi:DNA-binding NarL/FixJ family response regulator
MRSAIVVNGHHLLTSYQHLSEEVSLEGCNVFVAHFLSVDQVEVETLKKLACIYPEVAIIVLCVQSEVKQVCEVLGQTANAIIADDKPIEVLISALQIVSNGFNLVHPSQETMQTGSVTLDQHVLATTPSEACHILSERELAVLVKVHDGLSNKEVARQFEISESTVKAHLRSIFQKTGLRNRTQVAIWASTALSVRDN